LLTPDSKGDFAVPDCTSIQLAIPGLGRRVVQAEFTGGDVTSDGGAVLLRLADRRLGLLRRISKALGDPRQRKKVTHSLLSMVRQRVYGLALGYEDVTDHQTLRTDPGYQTVVGHEDDMASPPTLSRLENRADRQACWAMHGVIVETFMDSFAEPPEELVLDFDSTDDAVHGRQEGRFFHGYYDHYCFLPLYVFCGDQLLVAYLRRSNIDDAKHSWAILSLLVKAFRKRWPEVRIVLRADSGFCRHRTMDWCDRHDVGYIVGIARNPRLEAMAMPYLEGAEEAFEACGVKQRWFANLRYGAATWKHERRVICKAEVTRRGRNPRFVVTNLPDDAQELYDEVYCARGDMENRIKEQQLGLFADRTSCHRWWANQFRLLLSSLAYMLLEGIRRLGLKGTELERAQASTIRLKLLKIGAVILRNTRRVRFLLSSAYPHKDLFVHTVLHLAPG